MKYIDFEKNVAEVDNDRYEARLDRAKDKMKAYLHKNRVQIFDKKKNKEVASVDEASQSILYQDLGLPVKLTQMITAYAYTPLDEREADFVKDDDKHHNVQL